MRLLSVGVDDCVVLVRCGATWGSGVAVDSREGIVLTCSHVVRNVSHNTALHFRQFRLRNMLVILQNSRSACCAFTDVCRALIQVIGCLLWMSPRHICIGLCNVLFTNLE